MILRSNDDRSFIMRASHDIHIDEEILMKYSSIGNSDLPSYGTWGIHSESDRREESKVCEERCQNLKEAARIFSSHPQTKILIQLVEEMCE